MEFPQLYGLFVALDPDDLLKPVAYSLDYNKLQDIAPNKDRCWNIASSQSTKNTVRYSNEDVYPYYVIKKVPLVI